MYQQPLPFPTHSPPPPRAANHSIEKRGAGTSDRPYGSCLALPGLALPGLVLPIASVRATFGSARRCAGCNNISEGGPAGLAVARLWCAGTIVHSSLALKGLPTQPGATDH